MIDSYDSSSGCTLEQQWTPISITKGLGANDPTPGFRPPANTEDTETGPFGGGSFVGPTNKELNPYFSNILGGDGSYWMKNNDYMAIVHGDSAGEAKDLSLPKLSMGMSADYLTALKYNTSYVRIGSRIFGKRG